MTFEEFVLAKLQGASERFEAAHASTKEAILAFQDSLNRKSEAKGAAFHAGTMTEEARKLGADAVRLIDEIPLMGGSLPKTDPPGWKLT